MKESVSVGDDLGMTGYKLTFCCVAARKTEAPNVSWASGTPTPLET